MLRRNKILMTQHVPESWKYSDSSKNAIYRLFQMLKYPKYLKNKKSKFADSAFVPELWNFLEIEKQTSIHNLLITTSVLICYKAYLVAFSHFSFVFQNFECWKTCFVNIFGKINSRDFDSLRSIE